MVTWNNEFEVNGEILLNTNREEGMTYNFKSWLQNRQTNRGRDPITDHVVSTGYLLTKLESTILC